MTVEKKLIILDRDGVINHDSDDYIKSPDEWQPIHGSLEAIAKLHQWGYKIVVTTNQSGIAKGLFTMDTLSAIHEKMLEAVSSAGGKIDAIFFCPHEDSDECSCRKPSPGLFDSIAVRFGMELTNVPMIGDSLRDLQAAETASGQPILVLTGKGKQTQKKNLPSKTKVYDNLSAYVTELLQAQAAEQYSS